MKHVMREVCVRLRGGVHGSAAEHGVTANRSVLAGDRMLIDTGSMIINCLI